MEEFYFCGEVIAPDGLGILRPLLEGRPAPEIEVWRSGFDGSDILRATGPLWALDLDAGQGAKKFFSGDIEADRDNALRLIGELSDLFREAGMRHRIELSTELDRELLAYFHHEWPQEA
ncbi:MAG TPA: hypothetical protein VEQ60_02150 [Longimicrobium sp.]|nr:hypothetical protein [Longimicrobium sp.]